MKKNFVCIECPRGCELTAETTEKGVSVTGNFCPRGKKYAEAEVTCPRRVVTSSVRGAFGMIPVPGTKLCDDEHYTFRKYALYNDIMRLACGPETRFNGNLSWAEVGTNPRDDKNETENDGLGKSVEKVRTDFARDGWKTFQGPSSLW